MIYCIHAKLSRAVKIGFTSSNPQKRLAQLQTGCPEPLELLVSFDGDLEAERDLHETFASHRIRGEWFRDTPVIEAIEYARKPQISVPYTIDDCRKAFADPSANPDGQTMVCPICGFEYVHISENCEAPSGDASISFYAECGSGWYMMYRFHEGIMGTYIHVFRDCRNHNDEETT